jgi:hypothetical protein
MRKGMPMSRAKRKSNRRFYCEAHKRIYVGFEWGGHRRICHARWKELKLDENPAVASLAKPPAAAKPLVTAPEPKAASSADQLVKTVRSYLAGLDEEYERNRTRLEEIANEIKKINTRQMDIRNLRTTILNLKDLK